jgi:V/A-type H+-transporting ATPase subunit E
MPLDVLLNGIEKEAQQKADEILASASREANEIVEKAKQESEEQARLLIENEDISSQKEAMRKISQANLEARKEILRFKQDVLDQLFEEALRKLNEIKDERYLRWMKKQVVNVTEEGEEEIHVSIEDEKRIPDEWLDSINQSLKEKGLSGSLKLKAADKHFDGGFIMKNSKYEIVCTFNEILNSMKETSKAEIIKILFGDEE